MFAPQLGLGSNAQRRHTCPQPNIPRCSHFAQPQIAGAAKVLSLLRAHPDFYQSPQCRALRKAVSPFARELIEKMYGGKSKREYDNAKNEQTAKLGFKLRMRSLDRAHINSVALRKQRTDALQNLLRQPGCESLPLIADGAAVAASCVSTPALPPPRPPTQPPQSNAKEVADKKRAAVTVEDVAQCEEACSEGRPKLHRPRSCYICKKRFARLHHFYDQLCPACASLNWKKRSQTGDLKGKVALVTGGRVKIGYRVALKLLRAGCHTIVTTRFPNDAARRFAGEADFREWSARLDVYGLDLRNIAGVEAFCNFIMKRHRRLDVLVNNACQTIRRPAAYYRPLLRAEEKSVRAMPAPIRGLLDGQADLERSLSPEQSRPQLTNTPPDLKAPSKPASVSAQDTTAAPAATPQGSIVGRAVVGRGMLETGAASGLGQSAPMLSQLPVTSEDTAVESAALPVGLVDVNEQQLDLRTRNSWLLKLGDVEAGEAAEVFAVNALAPFVINNKLLPLIKATEPAARKFIINVSAMEGKFYRHKMPTHPHTNMAKAALNMMTRTCGADLARENVLMSSVDTGWINDENPLQKAHAHAKQSNFQTPIDEEDAAARILDPVFDKLDASKPAQAGQFWKNYHTTEW